MSRSAKGLLAWARKREPDVGARMDAIDVPVGEEPPLPSIDLARKRVEARLPRDPATGKPFSFCGRTRSTDFEFLGLGVYAYVKHLHRMRFFFMLLALLSVSSLVSNGYGGKLTDKQINLGTWLFTGTSLGNTDTVAPSYGAAELVISTLMTGFLFWAVAALDADDHRVEQKQVTPADFSAMISGLPRGVTAMEVEAALAEAPEIKARSVTIVAARFERELILLDRELTACDATRRAYEADIAALTSARAHKASLSPAAEARLTKLQGALAEADKARDALLEKASDPALNPEGGAFSAGVAFVTFADARDAVALLEQRTIALPRLGSGGAPRSAAFPVARPPEPSDIIWENLGVADAWGRQVRGTAYMLLLSLSGAFLIGASSYLQPKKLESNEDGMKGELTVMVVGLVVLLSGYLAVFITVPIVEVQFMRHTSVTGKEVSQVLKLVVFQVMATLATICSFAADTAGAFNRDWYITGGFMLVNGMFVDLFVITCLIQGWGLPMNIGRLLLAPRALTQFEADRLYAGDGANMYVVDRLQLVTKFVVMCYICSAAIPLLHWVVLLVVTISIMVDETNLLCRLYPSPQTDDSVVKSILVFVMPLAVLCHLFAARVFYGQLEAPSSSSSSAAGEFVVPSLDFGSQDDDGQKFVVWSFWINAPLTLLFILREWPRWARSTPPLSSSPSSASSDISQEGGAKILVGRAIAGSVWSADAEEAGHGGAGPAGLGPSGASIGGEESPSNKALMLSYRELERIYQTAGRTAELRYSAPDTGAMRPGAGGSAPRRTGKGAAAEML